MLSLFFTLKFSFLRSSLYILRSRDEHGVTLVRERLCLALSWQYPILSLFYSFRLWYRIQQVSAQIQSPLLTVSWHTVSMASRCIFRLPFLHILL